MDSITCSRQFWSPVDAGGENPGGCLGVSQTRGEKEPQNERRGNIGELMRGCKEEKRLMVCVLPEEHLSLDSSAADTALQEGQSRDNSHIVNK